MRYMAMPESCASMEGPHANARAAIRVAVTMVVGVLVMVGSSSVLFWWLLELYSGRAARRNGAR